MREKSGHNPILNHFYSWFVESPTSDWTIGPDSSCTAEKSRATRGSPYRPPPLFSPDVREGGEEKGDALGRNG